MAGFIGTPPTNFFNVDVSRDNGRMSLRNPNFQFDVKGDNAKLLSDFENSSVVLGVRPEDIQIVPESESYFSKDVLVVEPQGSHKIVAIDLGGAIVKIVVSPELVLNAGDVVHLNFKDTGLSLFDTETENRIVKKL